MCCDSFTAELGIQLWENSLKATGPLRINTVYYSFIVSATQCNISHRGRKKMEITQTIVHEQFVWYGHENRMEDNRIPKKIMNWRSI